MQRFHEGFCLGRFRREAKILFHNKSNAVDKGRQFETKVAEAVKLGAAGYVRKPFTADQIKEKLAGILEPALPL